MTSRTGRGLVLKWMPRLLALFAALTAAPGLTAEPSREASAVNAVLHLNNGGTISGHLADSIDPNVLHWQSPAFAGPFDFRVMGVDAIYFPLPATLPKPSGEYCFELAGGDVLFGTLLEFGDQAALVDLPDAGRLHVQRNAIRRLSRWKDGAGIIYRGPSGLDEWKATANAWHNERGQLATDQPRASLEGKFALPPRARIDVAISWKETPDFALTLGADPAGGAANRAFRIEAWEHDVVILRETDHEAEISSLVKLSSDLSRVHFVVYLDQKAGRCLVSSPDGKILADLKIADKQAKAYPLLRLTNKRGDLRLERLEVAQWGGVTPRGDVEFDKPRLHLADGSVHYGEIAGYDPAAKVFHLRGPGEPRLPADQIESAVFAPKSDETPRPATVACQDSSLVSGELVKVEKNTVWIASPGVREPLRLGEAALRSLVFNVGQRGPSTAPEGARIGMLDCEGVHLSGCLIPAVKKKDATCLTWEPLESTSGSALRPFVNGRIVYHAPKVEHPEAPRRVRRQVGVNGILMGVKRLSGVQLNAEAPHELKRKALYLMSGDSIPCEVTRIDQNGVSFTSPLSASTLVPHDMVKAVELTLDGRGPVALTRSKRERLLTVPRMQKGNPPTHLVRSRDGDYLRGRILEMDDSKLVIEVRLQPQQVPRDRISRIIWLHPDEGKAAPRPAKSSSSELRVQAVEENGICLTFHPEQFDDSILSGKSDLLGRCRVALEYVDQLLLGSAIEEAATRAAYQQWKLQYAIEPKFVLEEKNPSAGSGTESPLVGKAAPDFDLDLVGGERFRLSEHKGKIVVLDFWATWCSHCLETMPDFVRLHGGSAARNLDVVAVNLEEAPEQISALLERHKWHIPVALDRDGVVAAKYGVTAIPQTVIIDGEGKIVRHFVGGGSNLLQNIDESLRGLGARETQKKPVPAR